MKTIMFCLALAWAGFSLHAAPQMLQPQHATAMLVEPTSGQVITILTSAAGPLSVLLEYEVMPSDLISEYYGNNLTITYVGLNEEDEHVWSVKYGGITLDVIENM